MSLADLVQAAPEWHRDALCQEYPDVSFFPERGQSTAPAKAVCSRCLVRDLCLADALTVAPFDDHGIRGGTSAQERSRIRNATRRRT